MSTTTIVVLVAIVGLSALAWLTGAGLFGIGPASAQGAPTTAATDAEAKALLKHFNMPFSS